MSALYRVVLGALDARLWKAVLFLTAVTGAVLLLHYTLGPDADTFLPIAMLAPLLYFTLRYTRQILRFFGGATTRQRMATLLEVIGMVHVLALVLFFTVVFGAESLRNLYSELFEVDFWVFPAVFATLWAMGSFFVVLHYRGHDQGAAAGVPRLMAAGVCVVLLGVAVGAMALVPPSIPLFREFGADLPGPTLILFSSYQYWLLVPALGFMVAVILLAFPGRRRLAGFASGSFAGLLLLANFGIVWTLLAITLPFGRCGGMPDLGAGFTRLHAAVLLGKIDSARRQLAAGARVDAEDDSGRTPLLIAVGQSGLSAAKLLVEHGAQVDSGNAYGTSPLHAAAAAGRGDVVEWLLARGARPNVMDRNGATPLHRSAYLDQGDSTELLIAAGGDVNAEDRTGNTPLDIAYLGKNARVVAILEARGGVRSTKESRKRKIDADKPVARRNTPVGSCGV